MRKFSYRCVGIAGAGESKQQRLSLSVDTNPVLLNFFSNFFFIQNESSLDSATLGIQVVYSKSVEAWI